MSARKLNLSSLFASTYIVIGKKIGVKQSVDKIGIEPPPPAALDEQTPGGDCLRHKDTPLFGDWQ